MKMKMNCKSLLLVLTVAMIMGLTLSIVTYADTLEHYLVDGTETTIDSEGWRDHTGTGTKNAFNYGFTSENGILSYKATRKSTSTGAIFTQLWTPTVNSMKNFVSGNTVNHLSFRIKLDAPTGTQTYASTFCLGSYDPRVVFLSELIRFDENRKIVLGGTPGTGTGTAQIVLVEGTGTELMSFSYGKWYTITFRIDTLDPSIAKVVATVLDEDTGIETTSSLYDISTPNEIQVLRFMNYVGFGGAVGNEVNIHIDYIKASREASGIEILESNHTGIPSARGDYRQNLTLKNYTGTEQQASLLMGLYKSDGRLIGVAMGEPVTIESGGTDVVRARFNLLPADIEVGDYIKSFVFNNVNNLMPHTNPFITHIIGDVGYNSAMDAFEAADALNPPPEGITVFTGSSSVRTWGTLVEDMAPMPVLNRGFGGSQAYQAVFYFERNVLPYKPDQVVLYEGDNDINSGKTPQRVLSDCIEFADKMREKLPNSKLYFMSIKPSPKRMGIWNKMVEANALLEAYANEHDFISYIDVASSLFDSNGDLILEYFKSDDLHLNELGYEAWAPIVKAALEADYVPR